MAMKWYSALSCGLEMNFLCSDSALPAILISGVSDGSFQSFMTPINTNQDCKCFVADYSA